MPDDLYDRDVLAWSEHQAGLLRSMAAGQRPNEPIDWANVIEEVESVGRSELRGCESLLMHAMAHLLKQHAWPGSRSAVHWRVETRAFLADARRYFTPSMRQRISLDGAYRDAMVQVRDLTDEAGKPRVMPDQCPFSLDELLGGDVPELLHRLDTNPGL